MTHLPYLPQTASQTAGPYVHIGLAPGAAGFDGYDRELGTRIAAPDVPGQRIRVEGLVTDGTGNPVRDALIEVWQPDPQGLYAGRDAVAPGFAGWGRVSTDFATGAWGFDTVKPGVVHGPQGPLAPHVAFWIVARGINQGLVTRMYFDDEPQANAADPVLRLVEWDSRRQTLIARRQGREPQPVYRFDIRLQGEGETVFFDV